MSFGHRYDTIIPNLDCSQALGMKKLYARPKKAVQLTA
jgi:hypothetical protein